ncbi:MAG TPA: hypothetical protein VF574_18575 [Allosphingosinicella sp.]|jgi:hypothetical protein
MKATYTALAAAAALAFAGAAEAKTPSLWVQCDGYPKPESRGTKIVKGLAAVSTLGIFGVPETFNPDGRAAGEAGVAACTAALADPAAASAPWIRRVTLNQGLAVHQLEAKRPEAALAALDAAVAAAGANAADPYYARSTGVSLDLLRALALFGLGRDQEGAASALRAAEARPWSARAQILALTMLAADRAVTPAQLAVVERLVRIDPSSGEMPGSLYLRAGRYPEAWAWLKKSYDRRRADPGGGMVDRALRLAVIDPRPADYLIAFAAARAGDKAGSDAVLAELQSSAKATIDRLAAAKVPTPPDRLAQVEAMLFRPRDQWQPMIDAANLLAAGDAAAAQERLVSATEWPAPPLLIGLVRDLRSKLPPAARKGLVAIDPDLTEGKVAPSPEARLARLANAAVFESLPEPEDENRLNGFSRQFGLGLKSTGFKSKTLDTGLTRIEFVGSVSSPLAVEEMTLLRAAQLARESGRKGFVIEKRSDYTRYSQMTMNGTPVGPQRLAGYMTRIEVRFTDEPDPAAIPAAALIDTLAPIYIRPKPAA